MKLKLKILGGYISSRRYEATFRSRSYVTTGYGHNRKQARDEVRRNIREHIEELNKAIDEKDEWDE